MQRECRVTKVVLPLHSLYTFVAMNSDSGVAKVSQWNTDHTSKFQFDGVNLEGVFLRFSYSYTWLLIVLWLSFIIVQTISEYGSLCLYNQYNTPGECLQPINCIRVVRRVNSQLTDEFQICQESNQFATVCNTASDSRIFCLQILTLPTLDTVQ